MLKRRLVSKRNYTPICLFLTSIAIAFILSSLTLWLGGVCVMWIWLTGIIAFIFLCLAIYYFILILRRTEEEENRPLINAFKTAFKEYNEEKEEESRTK